MFRSSNQHKSNQAKKMRETVVDSRGFVKPSAKKASAKQKPEMRDVYGAPVNTRTPMSIRAGAPTRVSHREMITTIAVPTTSTFSSQLVWDQRLNPANSTQFPWASRVARNYEKYTVHSAKLTVVANNATTTGGWVSCAVDKDSADPAPGSKQDMVNLGYSHSDAVWSSFSFSLPCDNTVRFVDSQITTADQRLVDFGKVFLACYSSVAGATLDVYIEYDFSFYVPGSSYSMLQISNAPTIWSSAIWNTGSTTLGPGYLVQDPSGAPGYLKFTTTGSFIVETVVVGTGMGAPTADDVGTAVTLAEVATASSGTRVTAKWVVTVNRTGSNSYVHLVFPGTITRTRLTVTPISTAELNAYIA